MMANPCSHLLNCCFCAEEAAIAKENREEGDIFGWYYSENPQDGWMGPFGTKEAALEYAMDPKRGCEEDEDELSFRQIGDVAHIEAQLKEKEAELAEAEHQRDGLLSVLEDTETQLAKATVSIAKRDKENVSIYKMNDWLVKRMSEKMLAEYCSMLKTLLSDDIFKPIFGEISVEKTQPTESEGTKK